jgi:hypothetical protein
MSKSSDILHLESVSQLHRQCGLPAPAHPLVSLVDLSQIKNLPPDAGEVWLSHGFYTVAVKRGRKNKIGYGRTHYDFDEGILSLLKPHQAFSVSAHPDDHPQGWMLAFSWDLLAGYPLAEKIGGYGYFSYQVNEALHLSDSEEQSLLQLCIRLKRNATCALMGSVRM